VLSKGRHPFGERFEREKNILEGKCDLSHIDKELLQEKQFEAVHLIGQMLQSEAEKRPSADELLKHVFFWPNDKKLKLMQDLSDKLEFNN